MNTLFEQLLQTPVVYVTRDIERALGLPADTSGYRIIANSTPFAKALAQTRSDIFLIKEEQLLDTWDLLQHEAVISYINTLSTARVLVFKNTKQIEQTCRDNGWMLLNPPAAISDVVEPKISQVSWLDELARYLPPRRVCVCKEVFWDGTPFILQFNRSHTGSGTMLIEHEEQLRDIQHTFPDRPVRVSEYVHGPLITNNTCVTNEAILIGNISYQITGLMPFTDRPFATIGNDWALPHQMLDETQQTQYEEIATAVGEKLRDAGWKGLFGIDVVMDEQTKKLYLLEINCRQPASTTFESMLQLSKRNNEQCTIFEAHVAALLGIPLRSSLIRIDDGAQVILRNKENDVLKKHNEQLFDIENKLTTQGFVVTRYPNTAPGSDLLRIQSEKGLMEAHGVFNTLGHRICDIIDHAV